MSVTNNQAIEVMIYHTLEMLLMLFRISNDGLLVTMATWNSI